jgi:hypothetical protein
MEISEISCLWPLQGVDFVGMMSTIFRRDYKFVYGTRRFGSFMHFMSVFWSEIELEEVERNYENVSKLKV